MSAATSDEWSLEAVGQGFKGWVEEVGERVGLDGSETIVLKQSPDDDDGRAKIIDEKNDSSGGATSTTAASESEQAGHIEDEKANTRELNMVTSSTLEKTSQNHDNRRLRDAAST